MADHFYPSCIAYIFQLYTMEDIGLKDWFLSTKWLHGICGKQVRYFAKNDQMQVYFLTVFLLPPPEIWLMLFHLLDGPFHSLAHSSLSYFLFITTTAYDLSSDLRFRGSLKKSQQA